MARKPRKQQPDETSGAERVLQWASAYGAPIRLLEGWDPDTGAWAQTSPVGIALGSIQNGVHPSTAAKLVSMHQLTHLIARGRDYESNASEDRLLIPVEIRAFVDLARSADLAESLAEANLIDTVRKGTKDDPRLALSLLARRFPSRWREQTAILQAEEIDERDAVITQAITDPAVAMQLAAVAHTIEDRALEAERAADAADV